MAFGFTGRIGVLLLIGAATAPAFAAGPEEIGYKRGSLGVSAILAADFPRAEAQLNSMDGVTAGDPLRLINLGNVYAGTGRIYDAQRAYAAALRAPDVEVTTADGGVTTTHDVARVALNRIKFVAASR